MLAVSYGYAFSFAAGYVLGWAAKTLVAVAAGGLCLGPMPPGYLRAMRTVAVVLAAVSVVAGAVYLGEYALAYQGGNPYEIWALLRSRAAGPLTDLIHRVNPVFPLLPWAPYWWAYYGQVASVFVAQLLWVPSVRRRPLPVLCIALFVAVQTILEQSVTWFTHPRSMFWW